MCGCKFKHPALMVPAGVKTQPGLCLPSPVPYRCPRKGYSFLISHPRGDIVL